MKYFSLIIIAIINIKSAITPAIIAGTFIFLKKDNKAEPVHCVFNGSFLHNSEIAVLLYSSISFDGSLYIDPPTGNITKTEF